MKATAQAHSNIAFIKYFGKKDETLRIPTNGSISMNLSNLTTTTTVEFSARYPKDSIRIDGESLQQEITRVIEHLERIRTLAGIHDRARVESRNNFPKSAGLSSSASGFAALTVAGCKAAGLDMHEKELTILARLGSGSSCRSIPSGFIEWIKGTSYKTSYAKSIYPPSYFSIIDIVVVVSHEAKKIPTSEAQRLIRTNPFFHTRLKHIKKKITMIKEAIRNKNFPLFGTIVEQEALEFHGILFANTPSFVYLYPETLKLLFLVQEWRKEGLLVYWSVNTGHDAHLLCQKKDGKEVLRRIKALKFVRQSIINTPAEGTLLIHKHLF